MHWFNNNNIDDDINYNLVDLNDSYLHAFNSKFRRNSWKQLAYGFIYSIYLFATLFINEMI